MARLRKRQGSGGLTGAGDGTGYYDNPYDGGFYGGSWWWTPSGIAVRYAIVALILGLIFSFFLASYWHARRRLRRGLEPLPYHRWMVGRYPAQPGDPHAPSRYPHYQPYPPEQGIPMEHYGPSPPAYHAAGAPPPIYQPPEAGSKGLTDESYVRVQPLPPMPLEQAESSEPPAAPH